MSASYEAALNWAWFAGIVSGYDENTTGPNDPITREQMAVLILRTAEKFEIKLPAVDAKTAFQDDGDIAAWAKDAVYAMQQAGVLAGKPGNLFDPQGPLTRAEMAKIMYFVLDFGGKLGAAYEVK